MPLAGVTEVEPTDPCQDRLSSPPALLGIQPTWPFFGDARTTHDYGILGRCLPRLTGSLLHVPHRRLRLSLGLQHIDETLCVIRHIHNSRRVQVSQNLETVLPLGIAAFAGILGGRFEAAQNILLGNLLDVRILRKRLPSPPPSTYRLTLTNDSHLSLR